MKQPDLAIEMAVFTLVILLTASLPGSITGMATATVPAPQKTGFVYEIVPDIKQSIDYGLNDYQQLAAAAKEIADSCSARSDTDACISEFAEYGSFDEHGNRKINSHLSLRFGSCENNLNNIFNEFVQALQDCKGQEGCYCGSLSVSELPDGYAIRLEQKDINTVASLMKDGTVVKEASFVNNLIYVNENKYAPENKVETVALQSVDVSNSISSENAVFFYATGADGQDGRVFVAGADGNSGLLFKGAISRAAPTIKQCSIEKSAYKFCGISSRTIQAYDKISGKTSELPILYPFALKIK